MGEEEEEEEDGEEGERGKLGDTVLKRGYGESSSGFEFEFEFVEETLASESASSSSSSSSSLVPVLVLNIESSLIFVCRMTLLTLLDKMRPWSAALATLYRGSVFAAIALVDFE